MTALAPEAMNSDTHDDGLNHVVCWCDEDMALCGKVVKDADWLDYDEQIEHDCIVCIDMEEKPCPRCGAV